MRPLLLPTLLVGILWIACAGAAPPPDLQAPMPNVAGPEELEARALLLLLVDQQIFDPFSARRAVDANSQLRAEAARSVARAGDARGGEMLRNLVLDEDVEVRRDAVFGLGVLGDVDGIPSLLRAVRDADRTTGVLAVEALAKLDASLPRVVDALEGLPPEEFWSRLAPSLFRFPGERALPTVRRALIEGGSAVYNHAIYALARNAQPSSAALLRELLGDPDPWLRGWAARALGEIGEGGDVERLRPVLESPEAGPVIQALRSIRRLVTAGASAPPGALKESLRALSSDPRPGVRISALETAGAWLRDPELGEVLADRFVNGQGREREVALLALAASRQPRAAEWIGVASASEVTALRRHAASAAGLLGDDGILLRLVADAEPSVRAAATSELLRLAGAAGGERARTALADPDPVVRAVAFEWAADHPVISVPELLAALGGMGPTDIIEAQLAGLNAAKARAGESEGDRELVVAALELLATEADFVLRSGAAAAIAELGEPRPASGPVESKRGVAVYRDIALQASGTPVVRLTTADGDIDLRLECAQAPLTCVNFLQLVNQGFYDGLTFHRVVPDFVIQGGDPRGDGYGGPGYMIRDEVNRLRYRRGSVGMALAGPHTGGSQFFITLSPQPHLDGGYTLFGQVVAGESLLDGIAQGDPIVRAREVTEPAR